VPDRPGRPLRLGAILVAADPLAAAGEQQDLRLLVE
jgi:hypothetical protein